MISRFEKHIGVGEELEINGEKFLLKPLGTEDLPALYRFMKLFRGVDQAKAKEMSFGDILANMDDDVLTAFRVLIDRTLEKSFPDDWKNDRDNLRAFGLKYALLLLPKIMELNSADTGAVDGRKADAMAELKKQISEARA